jgi:hypothetical protein
VALECVAAWLAVTTWEIDTDGNCTDTNGSFFWARARRSPRAEMNLLGAAAREATRGVPSGSPQKSRLVVSGAVVPPGTIGSIGSNPFNPHTD